MKEKLFTLVGVITYISFIAFEIVKFYVLITTNGFIGFILGCIPVIGEIFSVVIDGFRPTPLIICFVIFMLGATIMNLSKEQK